MSQGISASTPAAGCTETLAFQRSGLPVGSRSCPSEGVNHSYLSSFPDPILTGLQFTGMSWGFSSKFSLIRPRKL